MKRFLLSVAILAVAASCSKSEVTNLPQTNQIGFSTLNDRVVSKAANDSQSDYSVFAVNSKATTAWAINDYVTSATSTTPADKTAAAAPAGGPYYWPLDDAKMSFYAYAPDASANVTEVLTDATSIALTYTVPAAANEDFTVATPVLDQTSITNAGVVDFTFKHMLAKVTVKVILDETTMKNYQISDGSVAGYTSDKPFTATFTPIGDTFTVDAINGTAATTSTESTGMAAYSAAQTYMIAPQAFAGCKLQINGITVRNKNTGLPFFATDAYDLKELVLDGTETGSTDVQFEAGKNYTFTVKISGDLATEITFTAATTNWTTADGTLDQTL